MDLTEREKDLIAVALSILEGNCVRNELHYECEADLGGLPNPDEVRALLERISNAEDPPHST